MIGIRHEIDNDRDRAAPARASLRGLD